MLVSVSQQTYLGGRRYNDKSECTSITQWKQFNKQTTTDTKIKHSTLNFPQLPNNEPARTVTQDDKKHRPRVSRRSDTKHSALNKLTVVLKSSSGSSLFTSLSMLLILKIIKIFKKYYHPSWLCDSICLVCL